MRERREREREEKKKKRGLETRQRSSAGDWQNPKMEKR
jgi:hypothetical protein